MMSCRKVTELLSNQMEGTVPLHRRLVAKLHLLICARCRAFKRAIAEIRKGCRHDHAIEGDALSPEAREKIQALIEREGEPEQ